MQALRPATWLVRSVPSCRPGVASQLRHASLTSAIERGIRKGRIGLDTAERRQPRRDNEQRGTFPERPRYSDYEKVEKNGDKSEGGYTPRQDDERPKRFSEFSDRNTKTTRDSLPRREYRSSDGPGRFNDRSRDRYNSSWERGNQSNRQDWNSDAPKRFGEFNTRRNNGNRDTEPRSSRSSWSSDAPKRMGDFTARKNNGTRDSEIRPSGNDRSSEGTRHSNEDGTRRYNGNKETNTRWRRDDQVLENPRRKFDGPEKQWKSDPARSPRGESYGRFVSRDLEEQPDFPRMESDSTFAPRQRSEPSVRVPMSVPFTTAGSEFIYGTFAVKAAIQSERRKLYKLYIYKGEGASEAATKDRSIHKLALAAGVKVMEVGGDWDRLMSKMSGDRPHNGYVLEASPIPKLPVTALQEVESVSEIFAAAVAAQSAEDAAVNRCFEINGGQASIRLANKDRFPFVLMLDRILDPGNLGAIVRSAYFLGVDAIAMIDSGSSPFGAVTVKASAGAAEHFPILTVKKEMEFIKTSKENGWKFFAAVSADSPSARSKATSELQVRGALGEHPCVLMLGSEGEGLRSQLQRLADSTASITNIRGPEQGIDSLNVSVAAALLSQQFLTSARAVLPPSSESDSTSKDASEDDHLF